jgi:hypothetical protein
MGSFSQFDWAGLGLKILAAIVIIIVTWILASLLKRVAARLTQRVPALSRLGQDGASLGNALGTLLSMVVWLLGLIVVLGIFDLDQVLQPVTAMLGQGLGFIPNIVGAVFVFIIGLVIAKIVRTIITTALGAIDFGKILGTARSGIQKATGGTSGQQQAQAQQPQGQQWQQAPQGQQPQQPQPAAAAKSSGPDIAQIIASVVFALIMIVVSIASLQILGIASISDPAEQMLSSVFTAIPNIIAAVALVGIGVLIARFVTGLVGPILEGSGVDAWLRKNAVISEESSATPTILRIIEIAVVLFFAVMGAQVLGFSQITQILTQILNLGGSVLFGAIIIGAGFFIATIVSRLLSGTAATIVKWAIIVLFSAIGLQSMGVADSIIELAFGALVVGLAATAVLAFGIGGRDAAARQLAKFEAGKEAKKQAAPAADSSADGGSPSEGGSHQTHQGPAGESS